MSFEAWRSDYQIVLKLREGIIRFFIFVSWHFILFCLGMKRSSLRLFWATDKQQDRDFAVFSLCIG